jgi:subtilase-type serine protease
MSLTFVRVVFLIAFLLVFGCGGGSGGTDGSSRSGPAPNPAIAQPNSWPLYGNTESYLVPYATPTPGFGTAGLALHLDIQVSIDGNTTPILNPQLDTGSRGLWISRNQLPAGTKLSSVRGAIFYWSSGNQLVGTWTSSRVTFLDAMPAGGAPSTATATALVLVVEYSSCREGTWPNRTCTKAEAKNRTYMNKPGEPKGAFMGIGFDRTGFGDTPVNNKYNQNFNSFLNLDEMRLGNMRAGYILTPEGVELGLTSTNTTTHGPGAFAYAQLVPTGWKQVDQSPPDWQVPMGYVSLGGPEYPLGEGVIDTGITNMLLTLPGYPTSGSPPPPPNGTPMTVSLLGLPGLVGYTFDLGDQSDPLAPVGIAWSPLQPGKYTEADTQAFLNTGIDPLNAFNLLYDATGGYVGLQLNNLPSASQGSLTPAISAIGTMSFGGADFANYSTILPVYLRDNAAIDSGGNSITFNGNIAGTGDLTISGGGTVTFNCGAYQGGATMTQSGTTLVVHNNAC